MGTKARYLTVVYLRARHLPVSAVRCPCSAHLFRSPPPFTTLNHCTNPSSGRFVGRDGAFLSTLSLSKITPGTTNNYNYAPSYHTLLLFKSSGQHTRCDRRLPESSLAAKLLFPPTSTSPGFPRFSLCSPAETVDQHSAETLEHPGIFQR